MEGDPSFVGGFSWGIRLITDIVFRWIPGTVQVMSGAVDTGNSAPVMQPLTEPVTATDVVHFLQTASAPGAYEQLYRDWGILVAISIMISLMLAATIIYCFVRIVQVRHTERMRFAAAGHTIAAKDVSKTQLRWNHVIEQIVSEEEKHWRLAILEADIMLNELLDVLGYKGETMADKMKTVVKGDFKSIDQAWEAHRVRNQIAHQGSMHQLSAREARRVIALYEQIFKEFKFIA